MARSNSSEHNIIDVFLESNKPPNIFKNDSKIKKTKNGSKNSDQNSKKLENCFNTPRDSNFNNKNILKQSDKARTMENRDNIVISHDNGRRHRNTSRQLPVTVFQSGSIYSTSAAAIQAAKEELIRHHTTCSSNGR